MYTILAFFKIDRIDGDARIETSGEIADDEYLPSTLVLENSVRKF